MYVCVYVYTYIACVRVCSVHLCMQRTSTYVCIYMHACLHVIIHITSTCTSVYMRVCTYVRAYTHTVTCVCVCVCVCTYVYLSKRVHWYLYTRGLHASLQSYQQGFFVCICLYVLKYVCMYIPIQRRLHASVQSYQQSLRPSEHPHACVCVSTLL